MKGISQTSPKTSIGQINLHAQGRGGKAGQVTADIALAVLRVLSGSFFGTAIVLFSCEMHTRNLYL